MSRSYTSFLPYRLHLDSVTAFSFTFSVELKFLQTSPLQSPPCSLKSSFTSAEQLEELLFLLLDSFNDSPFFSSLDYIGADLGSRAV
jgi:hypothetical protein